MSPIPHRVNVEVNLATLRENYRAVCQSVTPCQVMPVLKANAYGLGVKPIATTLVKAGATRIAVAEPYEAMQLLELGVPIQILSAILPDELEGTIASGIILPVASLESARLISAEALRQQRTATVHLKIDTGMGRAGILWHEAPSVIAEVAKLPGLNIEGIFTHFPLAYESASAFTRQQIERLKSCIATAHACGLQLKIIHAANSDAINNAPEACQAPFNLVRCGINLHGAFDAAGTLRVPLRPVLRLTTRLAQIRTLPANTPIGYGHTYRAPRALRVGTISAGYADGLPLALSNRGFVIIHGRPAPILGRLSMDYTTISLEDIPEAQVGDTVTLLGSEGDVAIHVADWAALKGTHAYDIICCIGNRVQRCYISE